jgi:DNA repair exonuclease SbcCD ATPase subunit
MLIVAARIKNIKRIKEVTITPEADAHMILIAGPNMAGKTSVMDAISLVLGGAKFIPKDPVHHGAEEGFAQVEWDTGIVARRTIEPDGTSKFEVKDKSGKLNSPQKLMDSLLGKRLVDPLEFIRLSGEDRQLRLLQIIDTEKQIPAMDAHRKKVYDAREEVGRKLRDAKGERQRLGDHEKVDALIDVGALSAEMVGMTAKQQTAAKLNAARDAAVVQHDNVRRELDRVEAQIVDLQNQLTRAQENRLIHIEALTVKKKEVAAAEAPVKAAIEEWQSLQPRRDQIEADLARANEHNRRVVEVEQMNARRDAAQKTVEDRDQQWHAQESVLDQIDAKKLAFLAAATLPIPGLGLGKDDISFNGVPFAQASGAEKLRVALGIAVASQSKIRDILIRDAALLDDESMAMVEQVAIEHNVRVWLERVGTRDPGAIVIRDGVVSEEG